EMLDIIRGLKGKFTILLIEHKLDLVMQLSDHVIVMEDGAKIAEGSARDVAADPAVVTAYLGSREVGGLSEAARCATPSWGPARSTRSTGRSRCILTCRSRSAAARSCACSAAMPAASRPP